MNRCCRGWGLADYSRHTSGALEQEDTSPQRLALHQDQIIIIMCQSRPAYFKCVFRGQVTDKILSLYNPLKLVYR